VKKNRLPVKHFETSVGAISGEDVAGSQRGIQNRKAAKDGRRTGHFSRME
jgi:hypothetical protein